MEEEEGVQPLLTIGKALIFKGETEDDTINSFISDPTSVNEHVYQIMNSTLGEEEPKNITKETLFSDANIIQVLKNLKSRRVEIEAEKTLNVNPNLTPNQL